MVGKEEPASDDSISQREREHLLSELHRFLAWVGEQLPEKIEADGKTIELRELIWDCIHKKEFSEEEKESFMELVRLLEKKEKADEEVLQRADLTQEEAKRLYHEAAALIRAIMDLRECESGKIKLKEASEETKQRIEDAKRWLNFLKGVGKKGI